MRHMLIIFMLAPVLLFGGCGEVHSDDVSFAMLFYGNMYNGNSVTELNDIIYSTQYDIYGDKGDYLGYEKGGDIVPIAEHVNSYFITAEYAYYSQEKPVNSTFRVKLDGSGNKIISDFLCDELIDYGDGLYYTTDGKLYMSDYNMDNSVLISPNLSDVYNIQISENLLWFAAEADGAVSVYCRAVGDGSAELERFAVDSPERFYVLNGKILYLSSGEIFSFDINTAHIQQITNGEEIGAKSINVSGDWLIYSSRSGNALAGYNTATGQSLDLIDNILQSLPNADEAGDELNHYYDVLYITGNYWHGECEEFSAVDMPLNLP